MKDRRNIFLGVGIIVLIIAIIGVGAILGNNNEDSDSSNNEEIIKTEDIVEEKNVEQQDPEELTPGNDETPTMSTQSLTDILDEYSAKNGNVTITYDDNYIYIKGNGLPNHETGQFPNPGNPNTISEQNVDFRVPRNPTKSTTANQVRNFGTTLGGIKIEPGTAERDSATGWAIEAFQDLRDLGLDSNNAHVQPTGAYHYHGVPDVLLTTDGSTHSNLIGFAADGFPIYALYGYSDANNSSSDIKKITSSWQLKSGDRSAEGGPAGNYDGTYTPDFEFIQGSGDLDECGGRTTVTPEYPEGTYAYFMTDTFPYGPRCVFGESDESFGNGGSGGGEGGMPPQNGGQQPPRR